MKRVLLGVLLSGLVGCVLPTSNSSTMPSSSSSTSTSGDDRASGASTGTNVTVPDLTGMSSNDAESAIRAAGIRGELKIGNDPGSYDLATAKVCTQNPGGGNQTSSTLFVTIRFCHVDKPYVDDQGMVIGMTIEEATRKAKASGFTGEVKVAELYEFDKDCKAGTVCRFEPRRYYLNQDRTLTLFINRKLAISAPE